ncbi:MAG: sulfatase-like hydrolase/transferase, partial [Thermoanaerobaculia bacterium]
MVRREATAEDLNQAAIDWLDQQLTSRERRPFFLWLHYVEPHAPYRLHRSFLNQLGADPGGELYSASGRYDTEIAYVDHQISRLLDAVSERVDAEVLTIFVADHGESLGEHGYWGHGRHVYEATLWIPMGIVWPERLAPRVIEAPSLIIDLAPTILGLLELPIPEFFQGFDWAPVLSLGADPPVDRESYYQSHRGATSAKEDLSRSRQKGLLEVARLEGWHKEIFRVTNGRRRMFDVRSDRAEEEGLVELRSEVSEDLGRWLEAVRHGLALADELPPPSLSDEDLERLRALGYID